MLLLAGVTLNSFFSALILFVQFLSDFSQTFRTVRWLMGDLDVSSYAPLVAAVPPIALSFGGLRDAAAQDEPALDQRRKRREPGRRRASARSGWRSSAHRSQRALRFLGGPVGFIGIVVPHLVRLLVGADHRVVLPASAFGGAAFLVACDTVSRTALAPLEIPVGVVTAIIGGPFFLWLLVRNR